MNWKSIREAVQFRILRLTFDFSLESQPQNPEFRINPESFHPYVQEVELLNYFNLKIEPSLRQDFFY